MSKKCTKCGIEKPLDQYHRKSSSKDGRKSACKKCRGSASELEKARGRMVTKSFHHFRTQRRSMTLHRGLAGASERLMLETDQLPCRHNSPVCSSLGPSATRSGLTFHWVQASTECTVRASMLQRIRSLDGKCATGVEQSSRRWMSPRHLRSTST